MRVRLEVKVQSAEKNADRCVDKYDLCNCETREIRCKLLREKLKKKN